jgi:hypothetical protein
MKDAHFFRAGRPLTVGYVAALQFHHMRESADHGMRCERALGPFAWPASKLT